jgi:hypothetical protein
MIEALRIIIAASPAAGSEALACIRAIQAKSPVVQQRYNRVVEAAFSDPNAEFSPEERQLIAAYVDGGESDNRTRNINIRVSPSEYEDLQAILKDGGYKNISEYIRSLIWTA